MSDKRRETRDYRKVRDQKLASARRDKLPCSICGQPVNYETTDYLSPDAPTVDHIKSWRDFPELRADIGNLAVAHRSCNTSKGVKASALPAHGNASRDWSKPQTRMGT